MKRLSFVIAATCFSPAAFAADLQRSAPPVPPPVESSGWVWFGEGTLGLQSAMVKPKEADDLYFAPYVEVGGKVAFQPAFSRFGAQVDLQYSGLDVRWISPGLKGSGAAGDIRGIAHLSWLYSDQLKLGAFAGLQQDYLIGKSTGGSSGRLDITSWRAGVEGLYTSSPSTTWFAHVAYLDPWREADETDSFTDGSNAVWGGQIGASVDHRFAAAWKAGASVEYTWLQIRGAGHLSVLDLGGKLEHELGVVPGTLAVNAAWRPAFASGDGASRTENTFGLGLRYTYRFGAPETSAATTLLRY